MIPMSVVWVVRVVWLLTLVWWFVCLSRWICAKSDYDKAKKRILPELEKLAKQKR